MSLDDQSRVDVNSDKRLADSVGYEPNPDVAPYQPANFMSSTILKKVPIPKRHLDTFGGYEYNFMGKRGIMLHTDRYQVDFIKSLDGMTQRERLQAGLNYVEAMRGTKRRRELVPHRAQLDLILGGKQIEFEERFYISRELQKLKALAMPDIAKDLYHGRGIHLPFNHNSLKPRYPLPNDIEEEAMASAPPVLQTVMQKGEGHREFPRIDKDPQFLGKGSQFRTRSSLNRLPQLPSIRGKTDNGDYDVIRTCGRLPTRGRLNHDLTSLSRTHTQAPPPSRDNSQAPQKPPHLVTKGKSGISIPKAAPTPEDQSQKKPEPQFSKHKNQVTTNVSVNGVGGTSNDDPKPSPAISKDDKGKIEALDTATRENNNTDATVEKPSSNQSRLRPDTDDGQQSTTPNPLRGSEWMQSVPMDEQEVLRQTFQRLDTDMDGHIKYTQLKTQLPKAFNWEQERFIEEVYNLTNSITFFGVDEFMAMDRLSKTVETLGGKAKDAYASLNFGSVSGDLLKFVGKFDVADTGNHGTITIEALQRILAETVSPVFTNDTGIWAEVLDTISVDYGSKINKISFIAHIPLFLSLQQEYK